MIYSVGTDIVDIKRFKKVILNEKLMLKLFTKKEIEFINLDIKKAADNFACKEAIVKISGHGFSKIKPTDIEILRNELGAPVVNLYGYALEFFSGLNIKLHTSISNTDELAMAFAIGEIYEKTSNFRTNEKY